LRRHHKSSLKVYKECTFDERVLFTSDYIVTVKSNVATGLDVNA